MTFDELCMTMATKASIKTPEEWSDFFSMPPNLQEAEARLAKNAIWEKEGPSTGQIILNGIIDILGPAATILGDVGGIGSAYTIFKGLL